MKEPEHYIEQVLGIHVSPKPVAKKFLDKLSLFLTVQFHFYEAEMLDQPLIFAEVVDDDEMWGIVQLKKQLARLHEVFEKPIILIVTSMTATMRRQLVNHRINFIVPGKQMYLPALLIDFRESFVKPPTNKETLMPSAQVILLYQLLKRDISICDYSFKQLAEDLHYSQMTITKAVENLKFHGLCEVEGTKEKYIHLKMPLNELWDKAMELMINPVVKHVYVNEIRNDAPLLYTNLSALSAYTDINPSVQTYLAIEKTLFHSLRRREDLIDMNPYEGKYCLEVWKYNPIVLTISEKDPLVDPLSLYLSMRESQDPRIEIALEKILKEFIW